MNIMQDIQLGKNLLYLILSLSAVSQVSKTLLKELGSQLQGSRDDSRLIKLVCTSWSTLRPRHLCEVQGGHISYIASLRHMVIED